MYNYIYTHTESRTLPGFSSFNDSTLFSPPVASSPGRNQFPVDIGHLSPTRLALLLIAPHSSIIFHAVCVLRTWWAFPNNICLLGRHDIFFLRSRFSPSFFPNRDLYNTLEAGLFSSPLLSNEPLDGRFISTPSIRVLAGPPPEERQINMLIQHAT